MSKIGAALKAARITKNFTQETIGRIGSVSGKLISAIERGERNIAPDVLNKVAEDLDDPRLYLQTINELGGGIFASPLLDGEAVDLHRSSVKNKLVEELQEALESVQKLKIHNKEVSPDIRKNVYESIQEALDVRVAIDHFIIILCEHCGISVKEAFEKHKKDLKSKGLIDE